ncbi:MAG: selenide, water dikinase SelD [Halioglobus sp.]|nr:selenide, water dikinase SelD [Halioglobus sp.]
MKAVAELCRDLVLVGGGHSHVLALRMLAMTPIEGLRITLVSPASHSPYSGMLPGLIAGHYSFEQTHIDLARLCQWAGARFVAAAVIALDPCNRRLSLAGRPPLSYDVVSIDIGAQPELDSVQGAREHATAVKPVSGLWQRWLASQQRVNEHSGPEKYCIAIVGGGAGSVELALAIACRLEGKALVVDLWCGAPMMLPHYNARARREVMVALHRRGIRVHLNARVAEVATHALFFTDGTRAAYDELFWCTGASAAPWIAASGLATDEHGFLAVRDTLQALDHDAIFGAGDIATQINHSRPKAGVYAVRQAPVLTHNLRAVLMNTSLRRHRPQRRFLSLIALGDKRATAERGPFCASGSWTWRWKDRIDRAFMARFERLPVNMPLTPRDRLPVLDSASLQAACGGCGAKVGADALSGALAQVRLDYPQHCCGADDDAVVVPAPAGARVLQSVDVLRQMVSDPWLMGRIAANHALSDLYACGVRPLSALAAVILPYASSTLLQRELQQLLGGALYEFAAVGCQLNGGHSMQGPELSLGFTVNGVPMASDGSLLMKTGAAPGDQLILTKPLGTGVLFAGHMQLTADGRDVSAAIASMLQGNGAAAELALAQGASACTDITGFGLLGHLLEMLAQTHAARLDLSALPLLNGALEQIQAGTVSTMHASNVRAHEHFLANTGLQDDARRQMVFDPQTSGGLLIAAPARCAPRLCESLHSRGYTAARIIGEVVALKPNSPAVVQVQPSAQ